MDIHELSRRLSAQAESVARHLLPTGRAEGKEWVAATAQGGEGKSCKVRIVGDKAGLWADFAGDDSGDLIDLWRISRGISLKDALKEIKQYLGVEEKRREIVKTYKRPSMPEGAIKPVDKVLAYLTGRGLKPLTIAKYQVREDKGAILFPSYRDSKLMFVKHLALERDQKGKKKTWVEAECEPCLFGWQAVDLDAREATICEGEIDAMTLWQYGKPALSVPYGGGTGAKQDWIDSEWENLEQFETINLCMDMDEEGQKAAKEIANRLGLHRCRVVSLPHKDANECLKQKVPPVTIWECFTNGVYMDPEELKRAGTFTQAVVDRFFPPGGKKAGYDLPWEKTHGRIRVYPGEVSIWSGWNGAGKSLMLGQVIRKAIKEGWRSCIASFEMSAEKTLGRMVQQELGDRPPMEEICKEMGRLNEDLWIFDLVGTGKISRMMDVFEYAYRRYGITQFVVDSLTKLGMAEDDYAGQKALVDCLGDFVKHNAAHVHLVAHSRKGKDENTPPRKMDIKGTGALTDMVDNVYIVHRDKQKWEEYAAENAKEIPDRNKLEKIRAKSDAILICDKSRENGGDAERFYGLYFHKEYQLFAEHQDEWREI